MVDSVNGAGNAQNIAQTNRTQGAKNADQRRAENAAQPQDEVSLSSDALAVQAEQTAQETRTILEEQLDESLARDVKRVNQFI